MLGRTMRWTQEGIELEEDEKRCGLTQVELGFVPGSLGVDSPAARIAADAGEAEEKLDFGSTARAFNSLSKKHAGEWRSGRVRLDGG